MEKLLLTVWEAADVLSVSRSRVYELLYAEQPVWTGAGYCDPTPASCCPPGAKPSTISTPTRMPDRSTSCGSEPITTSPASSPPPPTRTGPCATSRNT
jgi:hypothetical protein